MFVPKVTTNKSYRDKLAPIVNLNFEKGIYQGDSLANSLTVTRASTVATDLTQYQLPGTSYNTYAANTPRILANFGLLVEDNRTNYLLNSTAPVTQTTGTLPTGTWWLWVNGTGGSATVTLGTATSTITTATAIHGQAATGVISVGGTLVVTVSGSLNQFQLEIGAAGPTSFIPTAGATVARGTEVVKAAGLLGRTLANPEGYVIIATTGNPTVGVILGRYNAVSDTFVGILNASTIRAFVGSGNHSVPATALVAGLGGTGGTTGTRVKCGCSWDRSSVSSVLNYGNVNTVVGTFNVLSPDICLGGQSSGTVTICSFVTSISAAPYRPSPDALKEGTIDWSPSLFRFIGDSLTAGSFSNYNYVNQFINSLPGGQGRFPFINSGVGGTGTATMLTSYPFKTFNPRIQTNRFDFIWGGTNDLAGGGFTSAQVETNLKALWAASYSQGFKPIALTLLPRKGALSTTNAAFESLRLDLNTRIRNDSAFYAGLIDVGNNSIIGQVDQDSNTTNYNNDFTHLIANGDAIVANMAYTTMNGLIVN